MSHATIDAERCAPVALTGNHLADMIAAPRDELTELLVEAKTVADEIAHYMATIITGTGQTIEAELVAAASDRLFGLLALFDRKARDAETIARSL